MQGMAVNPLSKEQQRQREKFRLNKHAKEAMHLYADADVREKDMLKVMIAELSTAAGRARVINNYGACHETSLDADACDASVVDAHETTHCLPPAGSRFTFGNLKAEEAVHLNGTQGTILRYDSLRDRYIVEC
eukprot:1335782-Prymnesium_polylepis.2